MWDSECSVFKAAHKVKHWHINNIIAVTFNPVGVGLVEAETCMSNRETVKQGP